MITTTSVIGINENALVQKVSGEMVILDAESGQYYTLNSMATVMLEKLQAGLCVNEIVKSICEQYEVSAEQVQQDLLEMINELINKGLAKLV